MKKQSKLLLFIVVLTLLAGFVALPKNWPVSFNLFGKQINFILPGGGYDFYFLGTHYQKEFLLKRGLDIQGGMQVVLQADMTDIALEDRETAIESARTIIQRRVDMFGISEPVIQTAKMNDDYRLFVELPGVTDPKQALELVGTTANLDFRLESSLSAQASESAVATESALAFFNQFETTGLTGKQLKRAMVGFDPNTGEPVINLEFKEDGSKLFADITSEHTGEVLAIFIDDFPVAMPQISTAILDGRAVMTGGFSLEEAKQLAIQLNAGALPVPIKVLQQQTIGASLGETSIQQSLRAGLVGIFLVMLFMIIYYGWKGFLASVALVIYSILTLAIYKILGITLTLPGIAGLVLSIGMAVDSNILIFERMKEELRVGNSLERSMELGFGRAWDSIKDANLATIMTSLILINPLDFNFLNSSGLVRGFGITLLIGVTVSLFTGVVVSRTLMRVFLPLVTRKKHAI
ncbi:MAG: protein translocase subunit SecD [Patescibacteria group bacterium]